MTRSRVFLLGFGLLLLSTFGTGFYLYHNLPELLRLQAKYYLQPYGVDEIAFEGLHVTRDDLTVDTLLLRGEYKNYAYQAKLTSGEMLYNWRMLFGAKIDSLLLSSLELSVVETADSEKQSSGLIGMESLLPHQLQALLPLKYLRVAHWNLDYRSSNFPAIAASGSLLLDDHLEARIQATLAGGDILAGLRSDFDSKNLNVDISLRETQSDIATLSAHLERTTDNDWTWNVEGQALHSPLLVWLRELKTRQALDLGVPAATALAVQGASAYTARIHHPNEINLTAKRDSDEALLHQLSASFHLKSEVRQLDIYGIADSVNTLLELDGTLQSGHFETTFQPFKISGNLSRELLLLPANWRQWLDWEDAVPVQIETDEVVNIASATPSEWSVQAHNVALSMGDKNSRLDFQQINLDTTVTNSGHVETDTQLSAVLNSRLRKQTLPQFEIALTQRGSIERGEFSLRLVDNAESMHASLTGNTGLPAGNGKYRLTAEINDLPYFSTIALPLLQHFDLLQSTVEIDSGRVRLDTTVEIESPDMANWRQRSRITLGNTTGSINEQRFEGLALSAEWSGIERWKTLQPLEVSLEKLNIGVEVKDIQWRASLPESTSILLPKMRIEAFSANMFAGRLTLPEAQAWDFAATSNQVTLRALEWQLSALVNLQPGGDIQAQGTMEGELPLTITNGRIIINQGYLRALPPGGTIRYRANDKSRALSKNSTELEFALNLLSDFQYQKLSTEVELDKAGNLLLGLSLEGRNPEQYEGQLINFNINLEQNLDALLQSLRLGDNVVEQIELGL